MIITVVAWDRELSAAMQTGAISVEAMLFITTGVKGLFACLECGQCAILQDFNFF
jgi:hypothetical protein